MEKFSLFQIEKSYYKTISYIKQCYIGEFGDMITESCFIYIGSYDSLEDAKVAQKEFKNKSLIIKSYE